MARRARHIDNDIDNEPSAVAPIRHAVAQPVHLHDALDIASTPSPAPSGAIGGANVLGGSVYSAGGLFGGGVHTQTTGTYAQVNENDTFNGTAGDDNFHGGNGDDMIFGFAGKDGLFGDAGADFVAGGMGDDWIDGGTEADILFGESGKDHLFGGAGNDRMNGGTEDDKLDGGAGADIMTGGTGVDFYSVGAVEIGANGQVVIAKDIITDFSTAYGSDDILFLNEAIDTLTDFNQRFGGNAIPKTAFQNGYVFLVETGSIFSGYNTTVMIDTNGDQAGGQWFAVAELQGVRASDLNWVSHPGGGGNFFL